MMGNKKRAIAVHRKPAETAKVGAAPTSLTEIKKDCEKALNALRRGNHNKALRLVKESTPKFEDSALFHRVVGTIYTKVASLIDDTNLKQRHLRSAVEAARKAAKLAPNSLEYSHFYANLMFDLANEGKEYEEVMSECERALAIENPNDPAKDSLSFLEDDTVLFSAEAKEARVATVQAEVRALVQKANLSTISAWMKNLGGVASVGAMDENNRFRLIPMRRYAEDPVESRYLSGNGTAKRPNEIKKANKTPEERRKEIEVRVAAARLLQQKNETGADETRVQGGSVSSSSASVGDSVSASGTSFKVGERRRQGGLRRNSTILERKDQVRSFWNSMSSEMKRGLLSISVSDLRVHFSGLSSKDMRQACEVLSEALAFGEMKKTWRFWACCRCGERFVDFDAQLTHFVQEHFGNLLSKVESLFPQTVDNEWVEMLVSCSWKPLDLEASVRMLEDQSKAEDSKFVIRDEENHKEQVANCWSDSFGSEEVWESFQEKNLVDNGNDDFWEKGDNNGNSNSECQTCDTKVGSNMYSHPNSWPVSDDIERAKLLEKISSLFEVLVGRKCLSMANVQKVINFAMEVLQNLCPGSQIQSCGLDQTPLCICFLEAANLKTIVNYLQDISIACGFGKYPEKLSPDDASSFFEVSECEDIIMLNESGSSLLLDEFLLGSNGRRDGVGSGMSVDSDSDSLLSWIYSGSPAGEQLAIWSGTKEERVLQGMHLFGLLDKEYVQLQKICDEKLKFVGYEEAVLGIEALIDEEFKKRKQMSDISHCSFESILRKRRDELVEGEDDVVFGRYRWELDLISSVLKEVENLNVNQYGFEDTYGGVPCNLCDLEAGEEDWKPLNSLQQLDDCVYRTIQRQKEQLNQEALKFDGQIMCRLANIQQLELKLEPVSAFDYRSILLPLVKSYMRAHLEDLAEKDATEKSDAAREAFLAELALDNSKHMQETSKEKKRNKDSRRSRVTKVGSLNDQLNIAEQSSPASDGDYVDTDIVPSVSSGDINELEDEIRRKMELEAEEQKLVETLEYQRKLENEAKQKLLAEQCKRNALEDSFPCLSETFPLKNVHTDNESSLPRSQIDGTDFSGIANVGPAGCALTHSTSGLSHFGDPNDTSMHFERQRGKKGRRRSSTKVPEVRDRNVSHGSENVKWENLQTDVLQKDHAWNVDCALTYSGDSPSKTLRQLKAEEDEEERFQADLKKAVQQSLDTLQARQKPPLLSNYRVQHKSHLNSDGSGIEEDTMIDENVNEIDLVGAGLQNEVGEYNCFLNVIIQSLWHLRQFREEFLRRATSEHVHVGDPCVVCALFGILRALGKASGDSKREPVAPTTLRIALSNLYPDSNFFQQGQMNDASEVLDVIFDCLHQSFTSGSVVPKNDSVESNSGGSWDCFSASCMAHTLFGMNISERMNCYNCRLESRHLKYTSFFHNINANALRTMKATCTLNTFDELLNLVEMNHQLTCDPDSGGCGMRNHIHHILAKPPCIFTIVLGWQNTCESLDDIKATLSALSTEIDISVLYRGLDPQSPHHLVSVVCYYGQHYHCFAYSDDHERWIMYDDKTVKVIGTWEDVLSMCERGHLQPQVLFYEATN